jgi:hypothetical protein
MAAGSLQALDVFAPQALHFSNPFERRTAQPEHKSGIRGFQFFEGGQPDNLVHGFKIAWPRMPLD